MAADNRPRIALCFFGITRSLRHTLPSIEANIYAPARTLGTLRVFAHLYPLHRVHNPRSGEAADLDPEEYRLLGADEILLEEPEGCLARWNHDTIVAFGDTHGDDFKSVRNLLHQLHSLREVTLRALAWNPDIVLFCRPDLVYFDSFERALSALIRRARPCCYLPYWQRYGGLNDRFALVFGTELAHRYGVRVEHALAFCQDGPQPLHAESLLGWTLAGAPVRGVALRAARMRAGGRIETSETFALDRIRVWHQDVYFSRLPQRIKDAGHKALNIVQAGVDLALYGSARNPVLTWRPAA